MFKDKFVEFTDDELGSPVFIDYTKIEGFEIRAAADTTTISTSSCTFGVKGSINEVFEIIERHIKNKTFSEKLNNL